MAGNIKDILKSEKGAVQIVEATFVFPVMFIILFFLIFIGNAFLIKAHVESVVHQYAVKGANYCADPLYDTIRSNGGFPDLGSFENDPYRYIFGGMDKVESDISTYVKEDVSKTSSLFRTMRPTQTNSGDIAKYNNYVVYSTFAVQVNYDIVFPIRYLGESTPPVVSVKSRAEVSVNDTAEFIRNTDMIIDLFSGTGFGQKVSEIFGKINQFISDFASK